MRHELGPPDQDLPWRRPGNAGPRTGLSRPRLYFLDDGTIKSGHVVFYAAR